MKSDASLRKRDHTRQVILSAAYNLFIRQGYAATSMRQIAERSRLALGSIYNHFPSKEHVFRAIIEERHPFLRMLPLLNAVEGDTLEQFVRNAARTLLSELGGHPEFLNLMLVEIVEFKARHIPVVVEKLVPRILPLADRMSSLNGGMRDIPPIIIVRAFLGMFFSFYITDFLLVRALPPEMRKANEHAVDHFADIFLHGVLLPEPA